MTTQQPDALPADYQLHWYTIERVLGQGGFGITYLARDANLEQLVAIKEYLPVEFASRANNDTVRPRTEEYEDRYDWGLERFIAEARTLARFDHSNIVRVYSVFQHNNTAYMVMRYEQGENFHDVLARRKIIEEEALMGVVLPILDGLEEIHRAGFIHRDIKPDNIYIRDDQSPVLLDFGSARQAFGDARTLTILVAPGYAPFEQYYSNGDQQGPWTDIYGLGATLYRAVTGQRPADAISRSKGILGSTRDVLVPATQAAHGHFSQSFLRAIDHALAFAERDRPQSIAEWREELLAGGNTGEVAAPDRASDDKAPGPGMPAPSHGARLDTAGNGYSADATTVKPEDCIPDPPPPPEKRTPWGRIATISAIVAGALVVGLVIRPYMIDERDSKADPSTAVKKLEEHQARLEKSLEDLQGRLAASDRENEQERRALEEEKQRIEQERRALEEEKRLAAQEAAKLAEEKRLAEEQAQRDAEKRRAEAQRAREEEARHQAEAEQERMRIAKLEAQQQATRARNDKIVALIALAEADYASDRLSRPPGNNALESYREVLELDPHNVEAQKGIERIVARYVAIADTTAERGSFDAARGYLDRAEAVIPDTEMVALARKRLTEREKVASPTIAETKTTEGSAVETETGSSTGDELAAALDAFEAGNYEAALRGLEPLADEHDVPEANYALGLMYARGNGVPRDDAMAVGRYRRSAERGFAPAQKSLGVMYATGRGVPRDDAAALEWYRRAAEQGNIDAQINLGNMYAEGRTVAKSDFQAYAWFDLAARSGSRIAASRRDEVAGNLQHVELEHARKLAEQFATKYAAGGEPAVPTTTPITSRTPEVLEDPTRDAASGVADYATGDYASAYRKLEPLAESGNAEAAYYVGVMHANGKGASRSDTEAVRWYRAAADRGYTAAQNSLGVMYSTGRGVPRDESAALEWYRRAAERGNADAQINLGNLYAEGRGVPKSNFEAYAWYDVAAESGNATASARRDSVAASLQSVELEHARKLASQYKKKYITSP